MPFRLKEDIRQTVLDDKIEDFDFELNVTKSRIYEQGLPGHGGLTTQEPLNTGIGLGVDFDLEVKFCLEKSGIIHYKKSYSLSELWAYKKYTEQFLSEFLTIFRLGKNKGEVVVKIGNDGLPQIEFRVDNFSSKVSLKYFENKDKSIRPYLAICGTGYYFTKEDLVALGEWAYTHSP